MQQKLLLRLLLLDFGHPMSEETAEAIKASLLNITSLVSAYSKNSCSVIFGISVINSDIVMIENSASFQKNYEELVKMFSIKNNDAPINIKVTVQEYRKQLKASLEKIIGKLVLNSEAADAEEEAFCCRADKINLELAVVTRKTTSLINDIMKDVKDKLLEQNNLATIITTMNFKIIQVSNVNEVKLMMCKSKNIDHITCSGNIEDLNIVFKNFLFKYEHEQNRVRLIISKDDDLIVKCDLYDCIINPAWLHLGCESLNDFTHQVSNRDSLLGLLMSTIADLEVLFRIPTSALSSATTIGFSRRLHPSTADFLTKNETRFNRQLFNALCKRLEDSRQGLLMRSKSRCESLTTYYFLTADGSTLLLNCVAPEELHLANGPENLSGHQFEDEDESDATSKVQNSLRQINLLEFFSPTMFSSGLYQSFKNQLSRTGRIRSKCGCEKFKWGGRRRSKIEKIQVVDDSISSNVQNENFNKKKKFSRSDESRRTNGTRRSQKESIRNSNEQIQCDQVHPALLSPKTVQKYRKGCTITYQLRELTSEYNEN